MDNRIKITIGLILVFGLGILIGGLAVNWNPAAGEWHRNYIVTGLTGTGVTGEGGEDIGRIDDFVIDENGRVVFAILSHGDKLVAVPFKSLSYDQTEKHLVARIPRERIENAPSFDKSMDMNDPTRARDLYRHFGQQPYWTEGGMSERTGGEKPMESAPAESGRPDFP